MTLDTSPGLPGAGALMPLLTRRTLLTTSALAGGYAVGLGVAARFGVAAPIEPKILRAQKTEAKLSDAGTTKDVLTYGDAGMPPTLRLRKGEPFAARLVNALDEPTTIHWHGLRIANG